MSQAALAEYSELRQAHLGPEILLSIGIQYELAGDRALGLRGHDWFAHASQNRQAVVLAKAVLGVFNLSRRGRELTTTLDRLPEEQKAEVCRKIAYVSPTHLLCCYNAARPHTPVVSQHIFQTPRTYQLSTILTSRVI